MLRNCISVLVTFFSLILLLNFGYAQEEKYPTGKGSILVSGWASYASQLVAGVKTGTLALVPSLFFFVSRGLGLGGDVSLQHQSIESEYGRGTVDITMLGIGPKFAYFFGGPESKLHPYVGTGLSYLTMSYEEYSISGFRIKFGGGICPLIGANGAIPIEAGYMMDKYKPENEDARSISLSSFYFALGLGLFIY